jgi:Na+/H+ antiporter NhaA
VVIGAGIWLVVLKSGVYPTLTASAVSAVLGCTLLWWFLKKGGSGIER